MLYLSSPNYTDGLTEEERMQKHAQSHQLARGRTGFHRTPGFSTHYAKVFAGLSLVPSSMLGSKDIALTVQGLPSATHTLGETDDK